MQGAYHSYWLPDIRGLIRQSKDNVCPGVPLAASLLHNVTAFYCQVESDVVVKALEATEFPSWRQPKWLGPLRIANRLLIS